ncbi:hypothetical protein LTS08_007905 [Lithohypha guttulata]|nr:hypothetical protein LTS08_007905 [Lithohypha guttulata]
MHLGNRHTSPTGTILSDHSQSRHSLFKLMWMQKLLGHSIFVKDESRCQSPESVSNSIDDTSPWPPVSLQGQWNHSTQPKDKERPITSLPRQTTFKRQNSERRERLFPVDPVSQERRAVSASRHTSTCDMQRPRARSSPPPSFTFRASAPAVSSTVETPLLTINAPALPVELAPPTPPLREDSVFEYEERPSRPLSRASSYCWDDSHRAQLQRELDTKWILNLSMHFRDKSDREKFFVTYAETPTKWRRVTVSCDYRRAEIGSLEIDLKELQFQRDKSLAIYEAIHESLPEIQFYETVTNLKLETSEGRLHVHVTEDVNEIISYPQRSMVRHVLDDPNPSARPMQLCESEIAFDAHLSGFVYRVWHEGRAYIKKEIPSPDTVDEFLYEINALHSLRDSEHVIKLEAIILDDTRQVVKGLLIGFAERGAIVDLLYDHKGRIPWEHRELWARQAVTGLRDIHQEGYVQGDFTLSNVVVDEQNHAKIIDINRRGCPVGWEPPEIAQKIASNQRISMYIGEKSDLYQLGMTLWALAMDDDEPERHDPPLTTDDFPAEVPDWFREIVRICLSNAPRDRLSATELVKLFPALTEPNSDIVHPVGLSPRPHSLSRLEPKQYIDPGAAVERDDLERFKHEQELLYSPQSSKDDWTFTYPQSSQYDIQSTDSMFENIRGRALAKDRAYKSQGEDSTDFELGYHDDDDLVYSSAALRGFSQGRDDISDVKDQRSYQTNPKNLILPGTTDSGLETTRIVPTQAPQTPSPFRLPKWQRSRSADDLTPKTSKVRLSTDTLRGSPEISPRTSTLDLPERPASAGPIQSERSSNDTIYACDVSVGETNFSGTTAYIRGSDSEPSGPKVLVEPSPHDHHVYEEYKNMPTIPILKNHENGYDEPDMHELTKI